MSVHDTDRPDEHRGDSSGATTRAQRSDHSPWNWLLLLPLVLTLFPPLYNHVDPRLFDIPFFYWYQLAAIGASVVVTLVVYTKSRG